MRLNCEVCVVGAGPAGALLAYLLAREGVSTVLLERQPGIDKEFRGELFNEEGEQIVRKYKLLDKMTECGILPLRRLEYWDRQQVVKTVLPDPSVGHVGIHVPQLSLLHVLIEESDQLKDFQLLLGTGVTGLLKDVEGRFTGIKAIRNGEEIIINSSVIVGADGRYSTVRKLAGIPYTVRKHGYDLLWAKIPAPDKWEPVIRMALVQGTQLAVFSQAGGYIQIGWNIPEGSFGKLSKEPFEPFIQLLVEAFPDLAGRVGEYIRSWKDFVYLQVFSSRSESWARDGLLIMGDAAHTMTPTGAFGLNTAMKDADVLAPYLLEVLRRAKGGAHVDADTLRTFEEQRRGEAELLQERQVAMEAAYEGNFVV